MLSNAFQNLFLKFKEINWKDLYCGAVKPARQAPDVQTTKPGLKKVVKKWSGIFIFVSTKEFAQYLSPASRLIKQVLVHCKNIDKKVLVPCSEPAPIGGREGNCTQWQFHLQQGLLANWAVRELIFLMFGNLLNFLAVLGSGRPLAAWP